MNAESCVDVGNYRCGPGQPLLVIAGPCVIESEQLCQDIAQVLVEINQSLPVNIVFKASFVERFECKILCFAIRRYNPHDGRGTCAGPEIKDATVKRRVQGSL